MKRQVQYPALAAPFPESPTVDKWEPSAPERHDVKPAVSAALLAGALFFVPVEAPPPAVPPLDSWLPGVEQPHAVRDVPGVEATSAPVFVPTPFLEFHALEVGRGRGRIFPLEGVEPPLAETLVPFLGFEAHERRLAPLRVMALEGVEPIRVEVPFLGFDPPERHARMVVREGGSFLVFEVAAPEQITLDKWGFEDRQRIEARRGIVADGSVVVLEVPQPPVALDWLYRVPEIGLRRLDRRGQWFGVFVTEAPEQITLDKWLPLLPLPGAQETALAGPAFFAPHFVPDGRVLDWLYPGQLPGGVELFRGGAESFEPPVILRALDWLPLLPEVLAGPRAAELGGFWLTRVEVPPLEFWRGEQPEGFPLPEARDLGGIVRPTLITPPEVVLLDKWEGRWPTLLPRRRPEEHLRGMVAHTVGLAELPPPFNREFEAELVIVQSADAELSITQGSEAFLRIVKKREG